MRAYAGASVSAALVLTLALGCKPADRYHGVKLLPITGTITLDGKPLANAGIVFIPTGSTVGQPCQGRTDAEGRYEASVDGITKGIPAGEFKVVCSKWVMPDGSDYPTDSTQSPDELGAKQLLPPRYSDENQTRLKAVVSEGGSTALDFALTKSGAKKS